MEKDDLYLINWGIKQIKVLNGRKKLIKMEKDDLYLILAKIKLLMNEYDKSDKNVIDYVTKTEKIIKELRAILKEIEIPSKYLIAEGFEDLYKEVTSSHA